MDKITKDEALKIASFTKLTIDDHEIDSIVKQLQDVLAYAERVQDIAKDLDIPTNKNINRQREDIVISFDSQKILDQAPDAQDNYFVVPKIL
ncbi:MAG: Asp-tRNA(Asn)/Glu-tRNA(Gln) amidotransferase subunit GatC [Candidatus Dependentiae bacterium]|nr:Asp-tRNA(Asn)/Glu-tRNA(Gln) amidotransferase subunit GatC [Candidatus Dependentiae bacterium]